MAYSKEERARFTKNGVLKCHWCGSYSLGDVQRENYPYKERYCNTCKEKGDHGYNGYYDHDKKYWSWDS